MGDLGRAFAALRAILADIEPEADRGLARDALRDALDRDAGSIGPRGKHSSIVAGTWTVEGIVHQGSPFVILEVRHRDLGTSHALKAFDPDGRASPLHRHLLLREGAHQMRLHHPALLAAQAVLRLEDGSPAILMDLCRAPTLHQCLGDGLSAEAVLALGSRLAEGLAAVHGAGLVHLDLTPTNILLPDGDPSRAILCDFGLSLPIGATRLADEFAVAGTPGFAAPEQDDPARSLDERADLFALGKVLSQALADRADDALASSLRTLCTALTTPNRDDRHPDAATVLRELVGMTEPFGCQSTTDRAAC